jgi:dTDP-4-dehydrorhamnose reductase
MMKILLLGANGQVGHELLRALATLGEVEPATRGGEPADGVPSIRVDLADARSLAGALETSRADLIVNAAAYTAVDRAEDEPDLAARINHAAVGEIGAWAAANRARVIHYSTDYVFDGAAMWPYREDARTAPLGVYGRTKLGGEQALRESGAKHLIFRTAWVYAARGQNFLRTMLRLAGERDELRVVADQIGAPTPARWIADVTAKAIEKWIRVDEPMSDGIRRGTAASHPATAASFDYIAPPGSSQATRARENEIAVVSDIFNLVTAGRCSWYDFACAIVEGAQQRGLLARAPKMVPITTAEYPTRAKRPAWSVLDGARLKSAFGLELPDWRVGLAEILDEIARG